MSYKKKLIEVALPLEVINEASVREKSIRHGHPSTFHLWWARRPLAACRSVLFASLIDDPSEHTDQFPTEEEQDAERQRLFKLIEDLVQWENSNNEKLLSEIREEILKATDSNPPPVLDPFAGGGSIPLEAQRLGLEAHASDLNPVAVLINKALIEIPPKFANLPPVNPEAKKTLVSREWRNAQGLADDIRYYGKWMRDEAEQRIGQLYPKTKLPKEYGEGEATVIAWLWARTVKCSNPACGAIMPLITSFWLSKKKGKETWIKPVIDYSINPPEISFAILSGSGGPSSATKVGRGAQFKCLCCENVVSEQYIKDESQQGRMGTKLIAIVAEGKKGRLYLSPNQGLEENPVYETNLLKPRQEMPKNPRWFSPPIYGISNFGDLFTDRQLNALTSFVQLAQEVKQVIMDDCRLNIGESRIAEDYADSVVTYLALAVDKGANYWSSVCSWHSGRDTVTSTFGRQAIPMVWDFAEVNPFSKASGNFIGQVDYLASVIGANTYIAPALVQQANAAALDNMDRKFLISTDPPYYDNIGYADLSDFFYVWLRYSLRSIYPNLFNTMLTPKAQEIVAVPSHFNGDKKKAQQFFEENLKKAFSNMRSAQHKDFPLTIFYAFKQTESDSHSSELEKIDISNDIKIKASTGWETMLESLVRAGFSVTGTWPMRTELTTNLKKNVGALASSIVLVCRPRPVDAPIAARRQFINELRMSLAEALRKMQHGGIAPVDLAQASIGPGMGIYSKYSKVIESDGTPLSVRTALQLINRELDTILAEQEGEADVETRWATAWFEEYAMNEGDHGRADILSKAKNTSIRSMENEYYILESKFGKVRLLSREELAVKWKPDTHARRTTWTMMQRIVHALDTQSVSDAGRILSEAPEYGDAVRDFAYRLYTICERKGWAQEALYYNMLVTSWSDISEQARIAANQPHQASFL